MAAKYRDRDRDRSRRPRALRRWLRAKMLCWQSVWIRPWHDPSTLLSMYAGHYFNLLLSSLWAQTTFNKPSWLITMDFPEYDADLTSVQCKNVHKGETYCCEKFTAFVSTFPPFPPSQRHRLHRKEPKMETRRTRRNIQANDDDFLNFPDTDSPSRPARAKNMQALDGTVGFNCRSVTFVSLPSFQASSSSSPLIDIPFADANQIPSILPSSSSLSSSSYDASSSDQELHNPAAAYWASDTTSGNYINIAASNADLPGFGDSAVANPFWVE